MTARATTKGEHDEVGSCRLRGEAAPVTRVLAVASQKGRGGQTTTVASLVRRWWRGRRVLLVVWIRKVV